MKQSTNPSLVLPKDGSKQDPRWNAFCFYAADASKSDSGVRIRSSKPQAAYLVAALVSCDQKWRCLVAASSL